jgi:tetratricopeptide (TPR) repeat protein
MGGVSLQAQAQAQTPSDTGAVTQLLGKAHALEVRGRIDMAKQTWQQVLIADPNNTEALAGLARAAKLEGHDQEAQEYLDRLRAINPNDPAIQRVQEMTRQQDTNVQLVQAGKLAQAGQYARAMVLLRQVYGDTPPPGDAAIGYYQTEAATEDGRPHAIAGLRSLVDKYPQDSRYQIALGKILTYNPRTRAEGRKLLEKHPADPDAQEALRQSLVWDAQNPATSADIRAYLQHHRDTQLASALAHVQSEQAAGRKRGPALTPEERAAQAAYAARSSEVQAAYNALNAHHIDDAETRFKAVLTKNPQDSQVLAGMGYVRMNQSNFGGAISYLEQSQQSGSHDPAVEKALRDSRFYYTMQQATTALNENDLVTAQNQFQAALTMRHDDAQALLGLGGTLLKAQQPEPAMQVFLTYVKVKPSDKAAWRGLFMAEYGAGRYPQALATDKRVPSAIHAQLMRDPDYLRTLASTYLALGRDADAQRVLRSALDLPFPEGGAGVKADMQLQFAALLSTAGHHEQAIGLYRQVLASDSTNSNAWIGLIQNLHQIGRDQDAYETLRAMNPDSYNKAMQEAGFETTVAAIYETAGQDEMARDILVKFLAQQQSQGSKPFVPAQIQLAGIYMRHDDEAQAYPLYQQILQQNPQSLDAWRGLLGALHSTGHDQEALAELQQMPPEIRRQLEADPAYLTTVGSIYAGLGQPQEAGMFLARARQHYVAQHVTPPADIDIQTGWLLYNSHNDAGLYQQLLYLGSRPDLTDGQRRTVQTIWANFAVRRADAAQQAGNPRRALAILNAAAKSFPNNPAVIKALATGYASNGLSKQAVAIYKAQDLQTASADDYRAAIGAALSANDLTDAETWLRFALHQYPRDPQLLTMAAKFEEARGDPNRAAEYYRASLAVLPPPDPGAELSSALSAPAPIKPAPRVIVNPEDQSLTTLLAPGADRPAWTGGTGMGMQMQPVETRPYLPSYGASSGMAPVMVGGAMQRNSMQIGPMQTGSMSGNSMPSSGAMSGMSGSGQYGAGQMMTPGTSDPATTSYPAAANGLTPYPLMPDPGVTPPKSSTPANTKLKDYVPPQASLVPPADEAGTLHLHPDAAMERVYGPYVSYVPHAGAGMEAPTAPKILRADLASAAVPQAGWQTVAGWSADNTSVRLTTAAFHQAAQEPQPTYGAQTAQTLLDGTPIVPYASTAKPPHNRSPNASARARAEERAARVRAGEIRANQIRTNQDTAPSQTYTGVSHPPQENIDATLSVAQYNPAAQQGSTVQAAQAPGESSSQTGDCTQGCTYGQQYPQPRTTTTRVAPNHRRARTSQRSETTEPTPAPQQTISYPGVAAPVENLGYPAVGQPYPLGTAPTDQQLIQQNVPPLRGYFDPRVDETAPLTERQQAELNLATIEGAYSNWLGGSVIGRYRSGTPGIDRLTALEIPFEASLVVNKAFRLTVVPKAVFLNSGQLDTQGGTLSATTPLLGSFYGTAVNNPAQQFASGVGGEVQLTTSTFAVAVGVTPYEFLVTNVIGRGQWRPGGGHFTLFGGRDPVKETQLSYAGLRDPGTATTTYGGNVWGGVVQTGGGVRFDSGNEKAGLYVIGEGFDLTGYHVLDNRRYDGTMGAYFLVKSWPQYGTLNIGGTLFGEHFDHNERAETYGLGGYFSPEAYFLAAVPVTFNGHYGSDVHYTINGAVGLQTFQEDDDEYFPLDTGLQQGLNAACTAAASSQGTLINRSCGVQPLNSNTGLNFSIDSEVSYRVNDHWYVGGFISANNTNNYDTVSGGFFARYLFKPQYSTAAYPTGLFPVEGFRPLRVP